MSLLNTEKNPGDAMPFEAEDEAALPQAVRDSAEAAKQAVADRAGVAMAGEALAANPAKADVALVPIKLSGLIDANALLGNTVVAMREAAQVLGTFKDAMPVEYNSFDQIIASNGNFVDRETKKVLGDEVTFVFLSFQDSYVVSPEVEKADKKLLRFSDDGIMCSDGTPVADHIQYLKSAGYPDARMKKRVVVVGAIESAAKTTDFNDKLVQFDLSPASRLQWDRFYKVLAYQIGVGRRKEIGKVKASAVLKTSNNDTFTIATFASA